VLIGYGKIGRSISLTQDGWATVGGDMEPPRLLLDLAERNPDDTFVILSTCRDDPQACGFPANVVNAWTPERLVWYRNAVRPHQEAMKQLEKTDERMLDAIRAMERIIDSLLLPLAEKLDGVVVWAGQHGTANSVLPAVTDRSGIPGFTRPYDSFVFYGGGIFRLINAWRDLDPKRNEEVWLIADARNHLKARDQKWPLQHPVLGQFNFTRDLHHERFGDTSNPAEFWGHGRDVPSSWKTTHTWSSRIDYVYSGIEVCSILPKHVGHHYDPSSAGKKPFGIFINEAGFHVGQGRDQESSGRLARAPILKDWVLPLEPAFVHGKWTTASQKKLGREIGPASFEDFYPLLKSIKCTFTTPSSGSGWATTKPWEAFAAGTVCFRHPAYDTQDHIYGKLPDWVRDWLSPPSAADLAARVTALDGDNQTRHAIAHEQYQLYMQMCTERPWLVKIEERLHG
jgi:hypothetical protein